MSAIMAAAYEDRVEILTDGAVYSDDGTVMDLREKVWRSDKLPVAVAMRGGDEVARLLSSFIYLASLTGSVDKAIVTIAEGLDALGAKLAASGKDAKQAVDGVVAAVSETDGPVLFYFHTYTGDHASFAEVEPFTLRALPEITLGSEVPRRAMKDSGLPMFFAMDGLAEYGEQFFSLMRRFPMPHITHPDRPFIYGIGGHVDMTTVSADGSRTERLATWPDRVGEKIQPDRVAEAA